jgi:hypothetical protein
VVAIRRFTSAYPKHNCFSVVQVIGLCKLAALAGYVVWMAYHLHWKNRHIDFD